MNKKGDGLFFAIILMLLVVVIVFWWYQNQAAPTPPMTPNVTVNTNSFSVASFNLQVFGDKKASNLSYLNALSAAFKDYDVVMFQEIRDTDGSSVPLLQSAFPQHTCLYSEPLGSTSSKERYMTCFDKKFTLVNKYYVLNANSIMYDDENISMKISTMQANNFTFERPPFGVGLVKGNVTYTFVNVHLKPEAVKSEIDELAYSLRDYRNVVVGGDLNADCSYWNHADHPLTFANWNWVIPDTSDTTQGATDCAYDRFITNVNGGVVAFVDTSVTGLSDHYAIKMEVQPQ